VDSPRAIAGQPSICGRVGSGKTASNQERTAGWKISKASSIYTFVLQFAILAELTIH
jgi:hypothetical protein